LSLVLWFFRRIEQKLSEFTEQPGRFAHLISSRKKDWLVPAMQTSGFPEPVTGCEDAVVGKRPFPWTNKTHVENERWIDELRDRLQLWLLRYSY